MGFTRERVGADGKVRYAATYRDLRGRQRSAGTFGNRRQADRAWQRAEGKVAQGYLGDPSRGRRTFRDYVEQTWLPNHEIEASTRQSYTYVLRVRILPEFGEMRMMDILPEHVREWVACMKAGGVSPPTIRYAMVVLGAIFTTATRSTGASSSASRSPPSCGPMSRSMTSGPTISSSRCQSRSGRGSGHRVWTPTSTRWAAPNRTPLVAATGTAL